MRAVGKSNLKSKCQWMLANPNLLVKWNTLQLIQLQINRTPVSDYWGSLEDLDFPTLADRELAPRTAREWFRRMGYCWADLKKGVYKDGHEKPDVVAYRQDTLLPWPFRQYVAG